MCVNIHSHCNVLVELMYAQLYYTDYVDYIDFIQISYDNYILPDKYFLIFIKIAHLYLQYLDGCSRDFSYIFIYYYFFNCLLFLIFYLLLT